MWRRSVGPDLRLKVGDAFQIINDGKRVRFGLGYGPDQPVLFDLLPAQRSAILTRHRRV